VTRACLEIADAAAYHAAVPGDALEWVSRRSVQSEGEGKEGVSLTSGSGQLLGWKRFRSPRVVAALWTNGFCPPSHTHILDDHLSAL
jgi:hypothetical protein